MENPVVYPFRLALTVSAVLPQEEAKVESRAAEEVIRKAREKRKAEADAGRSRAVPEQWWEQWWILVAVKSGGKSWFMVNGQNIVGSDNFNHQTPMIQGETRFNHQNHHGGENIGSDGYNTMSMMFDDG